MAGAARSTALGGEKPRRLLGTLALCVGEVVPSDRLAEIVWGDSPPRSADANLLTYVSSLGRKLRLGTVGLTTMIISRTHGRLRIFKLENLD